MLLVLETGVLNACSPSGSFDRHRFGAVVDRRAGPVSVDVVDVFRIHLRVVHRHLDARGRSATFGVDVGDAIGVRRRTVTHDLAVDFRSPPLGMFQFFEDQHSGTLAEHKAVPFAVERSGCSLWVIVPSRECRQQIESRDTKRMNHAVSTTEHDVGVAATNQFGRFAHRLATRRTP